MAKKQKTLGPRVSEGAADWYKASFGNHNAGAEYVLAAFPALYARTIIDMKKIFTASELSLFIDIHNSATLTPAMAGQHIIASCEDSIDLDNYDEKWEIDPDSIRQKLYSTSIFERACLEIWATAWWEQHDTPGAIPLETYTA
jgi:hypothetical protein